MEPSKKVFTDASDDDDAVTPAAVATAQHVDPTSGISAPKRSAPPAATPAPAQATTVKPPVAVAAAAAGRESESESESEEEEAPAFGSPSMMKRAAEQNSKEREADDSKKTDDERRQTEAVAPTVAKTALASTAKPADDEKVAESSLPATTVKSQPSSSPAAAAAATATATPQADPDKSPSKRKKSADATKPQDITVRLDNNNNNNKERADGRVSSPQKKPQQQQQERKQKKKRISDEDEMDTCEEVVASYLFPRLDAKLARFHFYYTAADEEEEEDDAPYSSNTRRGLLGRARKTTERPPNCVEVITASVLGTDIRLAIYFALLVVVLPLFVVGIPLSQIDGPEKTCYTYWGYKSNCDARTYLYPVSLFGSGVSLCKSTQTRLQAGAAFAIMTLVCYVILFFAAAVTLFFRAESPFRRLRFRTRIFVFGIVGIVAAVFQLISWAVVAGVFSRPGCGSTSPADLLPINAPGNRSYGVGFGINLACWAMQILGLIWLLAIPGSVVDAIQSKRD